MDDDLFCKPKRTVGRRDLFGLPYGMEVDRAFAASLSTAVPSKDAIQEEPWNSPTFEKPDYRAESQAKGLMQHELARELAYSVHDKNQVLLTGAIAVAGAVERSSVFPMEELPQHTSLVANESHRVLQRKRMQHLRR